MADRKQNARTRPNTTPAKAHEIGDRAPDSEEKYAPVEHTSYRLSENQTRLAIALLVAGFGVYLCFQLMLSFLAPLTWALVMSITFLPIHRRVELRVGSKNVAALISVTAIAVLIVVPVTFLAQRLIVETAKGAIYLENEFRTGDWRQPLAAYPALASGANWIEQQFDLADAASAVATWMTTASTAFFKGSIIQAVNVVLTFYILFFLLRDRKSAVLALNELSVLSPRETGMISGRFVETIHAIVFGTGVIAIVQGTLGGLMFWWLGLPLPLVWGTIMAALAVVPVLGAFIIWIPAAIYLALEGQWFSALVLAAWGGIVVSSIDNLLYPILVGNRLKLHTMIALISTFGGLIMFGASGIILGPAVATVTITLVRILKARFADPASGSQLA